MSNVGGIGAGAPASFPEPAAGSSTSTPQPVALGSAELRASAAVAAVARSGQSVGFGARGEAVRVIQQQLARLGFPPGPIDGIYGRGTQGSVAAFQRAQGLPPGGDVTPATLAALDQALQLGARRPGAGAKPNDIVFVGMGKDTPYEVRDLKRRAPVLGITDAATPDRVALGARSFDLTSDAGIAGYVQAIGLSGERARVAAEVIRGAEADARDETAQVVRTFAEAERGERTIERLVLSGHSVGTGVWGDENGMFELATLRKIAAAFPRAASQVEDLLIAGCYSSSERHVQQFREMFPNLKTSMAYGDSAPGTWTGAMVHNQRWEAATRGHDPSKLTRAIVAGTRKGDNVATWNAVTGYEADGARRPLADLRRDYAALEPAARRYFSGESIVADPQAGPLRDSYRLIQQMLGSRELPAAERPRLEALRDATIRMIFYDATIKAKFQQAHAAEIRAGYGALGLAVPDFSRLSRREALASVASFEAALAARAAKPAVALGLLPFLVDGIRDLEPSAIPNTWV